MPDDDKQSVSGDAIRAFVDRIESNLAVIVLSDDGSVEFDLPIRYLPSGIKAGDHLTISFRPDLAAAEATLQNISELKHQLTEDGDPRQTEFKL
jgi:hypothetical protein